MKVGTHISPIWSQNYDNVACHSSPLSDWNKKIRCLHVPVSTNPENLEKVGPVYPEIIGLQKAR